MQIAIAIVIGLAISGAIIWFKWYRKPSEKMVDKGEKNNGVATPFPNTIVLYENKADFIHMPVPPGPEYPASDGRKYHQAMIENNKIVEWKAQADNPHAVRPEVYAEALTMIVTKEYLAYQDTTFQKISMGIMLAVILCECIAFALI